MVTELNAASFIVGDYLITIGFSMSWKLTKISQLTNNSKFVCDYSLPYPTIPFKINEGISAINWVYLKYNSRVCSAVLITALSPLSSFSPLASLID